MSGSSAKDAPVREGGKVRYILAVWCVMLSTIGAGGGCNCAGGDDGRTRDETGQEVRCEQLRETECGRDADETMLGHERGDVSGSLGVGAVSGEGKSDGITKLGVNEECEACPVGDACFGKHESDSISTLLGMGASCPAGQAVLVARIAGGEEGVIARVARGLELQETRQSEAVVRALVARLSDLRDGVRNEAIAALSAVKPTAVIAVPGLLLLSNSPRLRLRAVIALGVIAREGELPSEGKGSWRSVERGLIRCLEDRSSVTREYAAWALGSIRGGAVEGEKALYLCMEDRAAGVRIRAAGALCARGARERQLFNVIEMGMRSPDENQRYAAHAAAVSMVGCEEWAVNVLLKEIPVEDRICCFLDLIEALRIVGLRASPPVREWARRGVQGVAGDLGLADDIKAVAKVAAWELCKRPKSEVAYSVEARARLRMLVESVEWRDPAWNSEGAIELVHVRSGLTFILVPGGKYQMGSREAGGLAWPLHAVTVNEFLLCKTECTQEAWDRAGDKGKRVFWGERLPIDSVSWDGARKWCSEFGLRLPSEAEWEYACRAGTETQYWSGDSVSGFDQVEWHQGNSGLRPHEVGGLQANPFGLLDMLGNVRERCEDVWFKSYEGAPSDGSARSAVGGVHRVSRGGSWKRSAWAARCAWRTWDEAGSCLPDLGFRPAVDLPR
jgi:formylglycine-generating enzyme required for sulfatase activity